MRVRILIVIIACLLSNSCKTKEDTRLTVSEIKCSGLVNPIGTVSVPDFSWLLKAAHRGPSQSAYQIIVGLDSSMVKKESGTIWDSGKTLSVQSAWIPYMGAALESSKEYFWRLRVWDEEDKPSRWSKAGKFFTGLSEKKDWNNAKWIGFEEIPDSLLLVPGVHGNGDKLGNIAKKRTIIPYFRKEFRVDKNIRSAHLFVSGLGQYEVYLNGNKVGDRFLAP